MTDKSDRVWARGYEDLDVYQRSMRVLKPLHDLVLTFPDYEKFDLANQMRRACKSVPTNIAEGYARRRSAREFVRHLTFALGSANEMEVHLRVAKELRYIGDDEFNRFTDEYIIIGKQLRRLIQHWTSMDAASAHEPPATRDQRQGD